MKIHQLAHGARFLFEGEEYVKTGPMSGTGKDGPRIFARYLVLQALDEPAAAPATTSLSREAVLKAFETFSADCRDLFGEDERAVFERARARFLKALE